VYMIIPTIMKYDHLIQSEEYQKASWPCLDLIHN